MENYGKVLGENLVRLRGERTRADVCSRILKPDGEPLMNPKTLERMEKSSHSSRLDMLVIAAALYEVTPAELLTPYRDELRLVNEQPLALQAPDPGAGIKELPRGLQAYISKKVEYLRETMERLLPIQREPFNEEPDDVAFWKWDSQLGEIIRKELGIERRMKEPAHYDVVIDRRQSGDRKQG